MHFLPLEGLVERARGPCSRAKKVGLKRLPDVQADSQPQRRTSIALDTKERKPRVDSSKRQRTIKPPTKSHGISKNSNASDGHNREASALDDGRDASVVKHLCGVTSDDPDPSYVAEWRFFLSSKGKTLTDTNLIRTYTFAVDFVEKWQDVRITTKVIPILNLFSSYLSPLFTGMWRVSSPAAPYLPDPEAKRQLVCTSP